MGGGLEERWDPLEKKELISEGRPRAGGLVPDGQTGREVVVQEMDESLWYRSKRG